MPQAVWSSFGVGVGMGVGVGGWGKWSPFEVADRVYLSCLGVATKLVMAMPERWPLKVEVSSVAC